MSQGNIICSGTPLEVFKQNECLKEAGLETFDTLELIKMIENAPLNRGKEVLDILWELI